MSGVARLKTPIACKEDERREFERLVRLGFDGSDAGLPDRIRKAKYLAFRYVAKDTIAAIAGLKAPPDRYRAAVFAKANAPARAEDHDVELGWVFVLPDHRGNHLGEHLCRLLLAQVPQAGVFAMTRHTNTAMMRILASLGFVRTGRPYPRRDHQLVLYLRSRPDNRSVDSEAD